MPPLTDRRCAPRLLASAMAYDEIGHWRCEYFLVMPDHVHALLRIPHDPGVATVVRNWKRGTNRLLGVCWQENFFDHRIRDEHEAMDKWRYVRRNPVVKGLCGHEEDWPHACGLRE